MNMQAFRTIGRSIRDAFKSVVRNFSLSLASVTCITITLIIIACSLVISDNVNNFIKSIEKDVTVVVFIDNDATAEEVEFVKEQIISMENVITEEVHYKSKDAVKEEMQESNESFNKVLSELGANENPLRDTITVKVKDINYIKQTADEIETIYKVNNVQYGEGVIEKLVYAFDVVEKATIFAAVALIVVTVFLIINTIKLTIFSRKNEIGIMRLVGASNIRIKFPFVIEGILLGMLGSLIPIAMTIFGYRALYNYFGGIIFSSLIKLIDPIPFIYLVSALLLGIGMIVGMLGSARAVRKYIKIWKN